jgi:hypothetical protein
MQLTALLLGCSRMRRIPIFARGRILGEMDLQGPGLDRFGGVLVLPREIPRRNSCAESDNNFR